MEQLLREQQKPVLQLAASNHRVVVSGGAGTGKTLIAMEIARRAAESGHRTALVCYNQLVGDWITRQIKEFAPPPPNLIVGRAIRVMAEMADVEIPDTPSWDYWDSALPKQLEERLTDPEFRAVAAFEYLVVDEAQDLLARTNLWQCLGQFLSGGWAKGAFVLLGDLEHQVLSKRQEMHEELISLDSFDRPVRWKLSENCRNYRIVGDTAVRLAGISDPVYLGYMRTGGSISNYDIFFYDSERVQLDTLRKWLAEFKALGYKPSEITLLSFRADHSSSAEQLKQAGFKLQPAWQSGNRTTYASVHAFKGMENKVVILTDVTLIDQDFHRDLFYTGMTRATETVRVLCDENSQETLSAWLAGDSET